MNSERHEKLKLTIAPMVIEFENETLERAAQTCEGLVTFAPEHEAHTPTDPDVPCGWCAGLEMAAEYIRGLKTNQHSTEQSAKRQG